MMNNETRIEKYFSKNLSERELLEFENQYQTDPDFKEEVDFLKNVKSVAETEDDLQFKSQLASYEAEFFTNQPSTSTKWIKPLMAVAAIFIIGLSVNFFLNQDLNEDELFNTYFEPSKNVSAPIVRSETDDQTTNNAFIAYSEKDYKHAVPLFAKAFKFTKNSELLFYEANALLASGNSEKAIEILKEHLAYSDALTNRTHWYLALAYIKTKQVEEAKQELNIFINSQETYKKSEATSLLKQLD